MIARPLHVASGDPAMFHVFRKLGIVKGKKMRRPKMNSKIWVKCLEKKRKRATNARELGNIGTN